MVAALCPVPPLPHFPGPWPGAPQGGMVPGWQNHPGSWSDRDSIVTLCSLCCLWRKVVLIPFHPLSMAVSCLQAWGRPVSEIGAIVRSPPLTCAHPSIMLSWTLLLAGQAPASGIFFHPTPTPQLPHLPFYFGLQQARPGMHQPSPLGGREEERRGRGERQGLLDSTGKDLTKVQRLAANHRRGKEYLGE